MSDERVRALDSAIGQIEKQFGRGAIMRLGDASAKMAVEVIPTGSISLDIALGVGGIPRGRVIEIFGPESTGKSTLAQHIVAEAQRMGGMAAYVDVEHALDPSFAQAIGINIEDLLISQPDTGEQASKLPRRLCGATRSTSSSWTASPPSFRGPRSKARWAIRTSASRPD